MSSEGVDFLATAKDRYELAPADYAKDTVAAALIAQGEALLRMAAAMEKQNELTEKHLVLQDKLLRLYTQGHEMNVRWIAHQMADVSLQGDRKEE